MDTISRENNSMLPIGGVIVGVVALLVGVYTMVKTSKIQATQTAQEEKIAKIDDLAGQVTALQGANDKTSKDIAALTTQTQNAVNEIATEIGNIKGSVTKLEDAAKAQPMAHGKSHGGPVVAGPGEYVVVAGDSGAKIARKNGCTLGDLMKVNPGVNWKGLKPGTKLHVPEKGSAAPAAAAAAPAAAAPTT
jgi:LysM repeat protein